MASGPRWRHPQQIERLRQGIARALDEQGEPLHEEDCCVNLGADGCTAGRRKRLVRGLLVDHRPAWEGDVILWDGGDVHDPERPEGCWGDRDGNECGDPPTIHGLCGDCYARLTGERPMALVPSPPSESFTTGAGRR